MSSKEETSMCAVKNCWVKRDIAQRILEDVKDVCSWAMKDIQTDVTCGTVRRG